MRARQLAGEPTRSLVRRPRAAWRYLWDWRAPLLPKLAMLFAVAYVIWPLDVIPDLAPLVTWLDDAGVAALAVGWFTRNVNRHAERTVPAKRLEEEAAEPT